MLVWNFDSSDYPFLLDQTPCLANVCGLWETCQRAHLVQPLSETARSPHIAFVWEQKPHPGVTCCEWPKSLRRASQRSDPSRLPGARSCWTPPRPAPRGVPAVLGWGAGGRSGGCWGGGGGAGEFGDTRSWAQGEATGSNRKALFCFHGVFRADARGAFFLFAFVCRRCVRNWKLHNTPTVWSLHSCMCTTYSKSNIFAHYRIYAYKKSPYIRYMYSHWIHTHTQPKLGRAYFFQDTILFFAVLNVKPTDIRSHWSP